MYIMFLSSNPYLFYILINVSSRLLLWNLFKIVVDVLLTNAWSIEKINRFLKVLSISKGIFISKKHESKMATNILFKKNCAK